MNKFKVIATVIASTLLLSACGPADPPSSDDTEHARQATSLAQMTEAVGMPSIVNFAEKRMMKLILELRDKSVPTYTYLVGMNNQYRLLCNSVGYGLPNSTQYTNPSQQIDAGQSGYALLQADPNGLYSPSSSEGTWVMCINPKTKRPVPIYAEPNVLISPFPLQ